MAWSRVPPAGPSWSGSSRASCSAIPRWPQSIDGGATWSPQLLPAGLTPLPDALAYGGAGPGGALAVIVGDRVLAAPPSLSRWSPARHRPPPGSRLRRLRRDLDRRRRHPADRVHRWLPRAVAATASSASSPRREEPGDRTGPMLRGLPRSATAVLRLEASGATTAALAAASRGGQRALVALWQARAARRGRRRRRSPCPPGRRCWPAPSGRTASWPWSSTPPQSRGDGLLRRAGRRMGPAGPATRRAPRPSPCRAARRPSTASPSTRSPCMAGRSVSMHSVRSGPDVGPGAVEPDRPPLRLVELAARATVSRIPAAERTGSMSYLVDNWSFDPFVIGVA